MNNYVVNLTKDHRTVIYNNLEYICKELLVFLVDRDDIKEYDGKMVTLKNGVIHRNIIDWLLKK